MSIRSMLKINWAIAFVCFVLIPISVQAASNKVVELTAVPENALKPVGMLWHTKEEFAPARGEKYAFRIAIDEAAQVDLDVLGPDGNLVRKLLRDTTLEPGTHNIDWNGLDDANILVPDEAYTPRLTVKKGDTTIVDDPRTYSGGEIIPNLRWTRRNETEISFQLDSAARALIRVGVDKGPMLREIMHWKPIASGRAVARWDGRDKDGVEYFADRTDLWTVVMAYRLPEFSVVVKGNNKLSYRRYHKDKQWPIDTPDLSTKALDRNGQRLSRNYFLPRSYLPRVSLEFVNTQNTRFDLPVATDELLLRVTVPEEDRWILDTTFYETGFYVDFEFRSEEEQGFVPMVWSVDTSELAAGRHLATVQLFGFGGFITSDTVEFLKE